jgi:hypothetical protein
MSCSWENAMPRPNFTEFEQKVIDYDDLVFWPWACLTDAEALLAAIKAQKEQSNWSNQPTGELRKLGVAEFVKANNRRILAIHHFLATVGNTVRTFERLQGSNEDLKVAWEGASHLRLEGRQLRNFVEHADEHHAGKGKQKPEEFIRETPELGKHIPGDQPGTVHPTGMIDEGGKHFLGGRLCIETVIEELKPIIAATQKLERPSRLQKPN